MLRSKGKKSKLVIQDDHDHEEEGWLISYADTITLLLCFFVIFFSEYKKKSDEAVEVLMSAGLKKVEEINVFNQASEREKAFTLSEIEAEVRKEVKKFKANDMNIDVFRSRREVSLRLNEEDFFHVGSFELKPNGRKVLKNVSNLLRPFQSKVFIRVEGHSDSLPVNPMSPYKTNLNLSSLRASQAANVLISEDIMESKIRVVGYGSARQIVSDREPAGEGKIGEYIPRNGLKNRRIEVRIQIEDIATDKNVEIVL